MQEIQEVDVEKFAFLIRKSDLESLIAELSGAKKWMTLKQAAKYLNISEISLRTYIRKKTISHYKLNGVILFKTKEIDMLIEKNKVESKTDLIQRAVNRGRS